MPELPEVETTRRGIAPLVVGRRVACHARIRPPAALVGSRVASAHASPGARSTPSIGAASTCCSGSSGDTLLVHLGMTGSLRAYTHRRRRGVTHDHVDIVLDSGVTLRYHDPRRFGAMLWLPPPAEAHPLLASLGPEPFDAACDAGLPLARDARPHRGDQAGADGQSSHRRRRQYLRQRIAVPGRDPADDPGQSRVEASACAPRPTRSARR